MVSVAAGMSASSGREKPEFGKGCRAAGGLELVLNGPASPARRVEALSLLLACQHAEVRAEAVAGGRLRVPDRHDRGRVLKRPDRRDRAWSSAADMPAERRTGSERVGRSKLSPFYPVIHRARLPAVRNNHLHPAAQGHTLARGSGQDRFINSAARTTARQTPSRKPLLHVSSRESLPAVPRQTMLPFPVAGCQQQRKHNRSRGQGDRTGSFASSLPGCTRQTARNHFNVELNAHPTC